MTNRSFVPFKTTNVMSHVSCSSSSNLKVKLSLACAAKLIINSISVLLAFYSLQICDLRSNGFSG